MFLAIAMIINVLTIAGLKLAGKSETDSVESESQKEDVHDPQPPLCG